MYAMRYYIKPFKMGKSPKTVCTSKFFLLSFLLLPPLPGNKLFTPAWLPRSKCIIWRMAGLEWGLNVAGGWSQLLIAANSSRNAEWEVEMVVYSGTFLSGRNSMLFKFTISRFCVRWQVSVMCFIIRGSIFSVTGGILRFYGFQLLCIRTLTLYHGTSDQF